MSPNQACVYCGAPLSPGASACDACGQPVPAQDGPSPEVPESYIEMPDPEEILPLQPPPATPARHEVPPLPQMPAIPPQTPTRKNNGLRLVLILLFILIMICCCILIAFALLVYNLQPTSLMQTGWISAAAHWIA